MSLRTPARSYVELAQYCVSHNDRIEEFATALGACRSRADSEKDPASFLYDRDLDPRLKVNHGKRVSSIRENVRERADDHPPL